MTGPKVAVVYGRWTMSGPDWSVKHHKDGPRPGSLCQNIDVSPPRIGHYHDTSFDHYNKKDYIAGPHCSHIHHQRVLPIKILFMFY